MKSYEILQSAYYDSIVLSLLRRNIISLSEAVNCLNDINKHKEPRKDLNKDFTMVKPKGLTNLLVGMDNLEVKPYE